MIEALRIIAAKSPYAGAQAMQCIKAIQVESPVVKERYNRVVELAFSDPQADFTQDERQMIAGFINGGESHKTATIRFRVSSAEQEDVQRMADAASMNVSDYIRSLIWPE